MIICAAGRSAVIPIVYGNTTLPPVRAQFTAECQGVPLQRPSYLAPHRPAVAFATRVAAL